jgi:hypothetical protein
MKTSYLVAFFLFAVSSAVVQFSQWVPLVFYGDDLFFLNQFLSSRCATTFPEFFTEDCANKFRPLPAALNSSLMSIFGLNYSFYFYFNFLLHSLTSTLVFYLAWKISDRNVLIAVLAGTAYAVSRFHTFPLVVANGPYELLALPFFVLFLWSLYSLFDKRQTGWRLELLIVSLVLFMTLVHERYIVLFGVLMLVYISGKLQKNKDYEVSFSFLASSILIPVLYVLYKIIFLNSNFVGTAGSALEFNFETLISNALQFMFSISGINTGPVHLVGANTINLPFFPNWFLSFAVAASAFFIFFWIFKNVLLGSSENFKPFPIFCLVVALALITPPLVSFRLEQRWLINFFLVFLVLICWAMGKLPAYKKSRLTLAMLIFVSANSLSDFFIVRTYNQTFYGWSSRMVEALAGDSRDDSYIKLDLIYFPHLHSSFCSWVLQGGYFFEIYGQGKTRVLCGDVPRNDALTNYNVKILKPIYNSKGSLVLGKLPRLIRSSDWEIRFEDVTTEYLSKIKLQMED